MITAEIIRTAADLLDGTPDGECNAKVYLQTELRSIPEASKYLEQIKASVARMAAASVAGAPSTAVAVAEPQPDAPQLIQPDADGRFPTPLDGALFMASLGIPQTPLRAGTKIAFLDEFQKLATADFAQIRKWAEDYPGCNFGSLGREGEYFTFEADSTDVRKRFAAVGGAFTSKLMVMSRPGRGHRWYRSTPEVKNIQQGSTRHGDFSVRAKNMYCVSPGSIHPDTGEQYRLLASGAPEVPSAAEIAFWESERVEKKSDGKSEAPRNEGGKIPRGSIHGWLVEQAGRFRWSGLETDEIETALLRLAYEHCELPLDDGKIRQVARSMKNYKAGTPWQDIVQLNQRVSYAVDAATTPAAVPQAAEDDVPAFEDSVINGIYREIVDAATNGTTIPRQFAFLAAKVYIGATIAGKVTFENFDTDSSYYGAVIGVTGTGKGLSWERTVKRICNVGNTLQPGPIKIINGADSGAGLKDAFFDPQMEAPIICYVDEITSLGHKASEKKNPEIIDTIIELANSHVISRTLAARGGKKATRSHQNARLSLFICGQNGEVITAAFAGRTRLGIYERLYPEYSPAVVAGRLPKVDPNVAVQLWHKISQLPKSGEIKMAPGVEDALESFWTSLPGDTQTRVRLKSYLAQDIFMSAYGRGVMVAEIEDLNIAIKIFQRQIAIRQKHFTDEVPDKVGLYLGRLKKITEAMRRRLHGGETVGMVAKSLRDFQTETGAYRDNELHTFNSAWRNWESSQLANVNVTAKNGHQYPKFVPVPDEDEVWKEI